MMDTIRVDIRKPLYGTYVTIREKYINQAIRQKKWLEIHIPQGAAIVNPKEWKKNGKRMEKVFNFSTPMVLYGGYVPVHIPNQNHDHWRMKNKSKPATLFDALENS